MLVKEKLSTLFHSVLYINKKNLLIDPALLFSKEKYLDLDLFNFILKQKIK